MDIALGMALVATRPPATDIVLSSDDPPPQPAGMAPSVLGSTPAAHWHVPTAGFTETAGRIASAGSVAGPAVTAGAEGVGPERMIDALGRPFWRFDGAAYLDVAEGLVLSNRAMAVFAVGRMLSGNSAVFGPGNRTGYGAGSTTVNTGGAAMDSSTSGSLAPFLRGFSRGAQLDPANAARLVTGRQLQVMGTVSRATANGGTRLHLNAATANVSQPSINATNVVGAEIGRYPHSPGTVGNWGKFDLYELVVFDRVLSNAEADGVAEALVANWQIAPVTNQLVLEGDSINAGVGLKTGEAPGDLLGEPGIGRLPATWRVFAMASSGNQVSNLVTKRDAANGWPTVLLPGSNVMAFEIGRNDLTVLTAAQHYANVLAYLNTTGTGVLQRGWTVRVMANIATGSSLQSKVEDYRALLRAPAFAQDTLSAPGQAFAGQVAVVSTDLIELGGATVFNTTADTSGSPYYQGDATHPSAAGALVRISGGDTPVHAVTAGLL